MASFAALTPEPQARQPVSTFGSIASSFLTSPIASIGQVYNALTADEGVKEQQVQDSVVGIRLEQNREHRDTQEDYYQAIVHFHATPAENPGFLTHLAAGGNQSITSVSTQSFFSVYDGHGGDEVAEFLHQHLHTALLANLPPVEQSLPTSLPNAPATPVRSSSVAPPLAPPSGAPPPPRSPTRLPPGSPLARSSSLSIDEASNVTVESTAGADALEAESGLGGGEDCEGQSAITEILRAVYTEVDNKIAAVSEEDEESEFAADSGSTAATCVIRTEGGRTVLYCANVGDSRVVLCRNGAPVRLTKDHRARDPEEVARIKGEGGFVFNGRVSGVLAVTRSFGHVNDKFLILGDPYTSRTVVDPQLDEAVIIASDGIWDSMKEEAVCAWVTQGLVEGKKLKTICDEITAECIRKYCRDNICIMVVAL